MPEQKTTKVRFPGGGSAELSGVLHEPGKPVTRSTAVLTHCFTCSKDYKVIVQLARTLASRGIAALRFDFTGSGQSEGDFAETTLATNVSDLAAAADWLAAQGSKAGALIGHSLGATAAILAARLIPDVLAVCAIASSAESTHLLALIPALQSQEFSKRGQLKANVGGRTIVIRREFVEELRKHSLEESVANLNRPFLIVHGTGDSVVPISEGEKLFNLAKQPKSFISVPGADHLFSRPDHAQSIGDAISLWLMRYLVEGEVEK